MFELMRTKFGLQTHLVLRNTDCTWPNAYYSRPHAGYTRPHADYTIPDVYYKSTSHILYLDSTEATLDLMHTTMLVVTLSCTLHFELACSTPRHTLILLDLMHTAVNPLHTAYIFFIAMPISIVYGVYIFRTFRCGSKHILHFELTQATFDLRHTTNNLTCIIVPS